jgi:hypothetical protein
MEAAGKIGVIREAAQRRHAREGRSGWVYLRARWIRMRAAIGIGICQQITGCPEFGS